MRKFLISSNNLFNLQMYVMILVSVKLFLRADEVVSLKVDSFLKDLFVYSSSGEIEGIAVSIQGKSDKVPVKLMIWSDNDIPKLCPIRHLLVYINEAKIKNGYIFPERDKKTGKDIYSLVGKQISDSEISYDTYNEEYKVLCTKLVQRDGPFGSHSNRKTGYLFAVWGGGDDSNVMASARTRKRGGDNTWMIE